MNLATLRPLRDGIVIRRIDQMESSMIVIPDVAHQPMHRGEVIAVGPGKRDAKGRLKAPDVCIGELVRYQSHDVEDGEYVLLREGDVLGVERDSFVPAHGMVLVKTA